MRVGKSVGRRERRVVRREEVVLREERKVGAERRPRTWCASRVQRTLPPKVVPWEPGVGGRVSEERMRTTETRLETK